VAILIVYFNYTTFINLPHFDTQYALRSLALLPQASLPVLMVGWSLIHELYFYIVFALLLLLPRQYLPYLLLIWLALVVEGNRHVVPFSPEQNQFLRIAFSPVTAEFIAGCFLALFIQSYKKRLPNTPYPLAAPCFISGIILLPIVWHYFSFNTTTVDVTGWTRVFLFTIPFVLMIYGAVALENNKQQVFPSWLIRLGDASYSIYLTHILILAACGRVWQLFAWQGYADNIIMITVMLIIVLFGGLVCYRYIEQPLLKLSRRFSF
jgi:exopolysaccharide production protein ExoZ